MTKQLNNCKSIKLTMKTFGYKPGIQYLTNESNHRRIQRFFAEFIIDRYMLARLIFSLLPGKPPYRLSLDRTNWKFGKTDINILMLSVCYQGLAIPLLWKMLPKRGNSNASERQELLHEYISLFGTSTLSAFMADREFVGEDWFEDLIRNKVVSIWKIPI